LKNGFNGQTLNDSLKAKIIGHSENSHNDTRHSGSNSQSIAVIRISKHEEFGKRHKKILEILNTKHQPTITTINYYKFEHNKRTCSKSEAKLFKILFNRSYNFKGANEQTKAIQTYKSKKKKTFFHKISLFLTFKFDVLNSIRYDSLLKQKIRYNSEQRLYSQLFFNANPEIEYHFSQLFNIITYNENDESKSKSYYQSRLYRNKSKNQK
jgi:hypothetical protein